LDSEYGFDVAFGGYFDIDPRMGSINVVHNSQNRYVDEKTKEVSNI
jgi:hypothetical protein